MKILEIRIQLGKHQPGEGQKLLGNRQQLFEVWKLRLLWRDKTGLKVLAFDMCTRIQSLASHKVLRAH